MYRISDPQNMNFITAIILILYFILTVIFSIYHWEILDKVEVIICLLMILSAAAYMWVLQICLLSQLESKNSDMIPLFKVLIQNLRTFWKFVLGVYVFLYFLGSILGNKIDIIIAYCFVTTFITYRLFIFTGIFNAIDKKIKLI